MTRVRAEYVPQGEILDEAREALRLHEGQIDWVTFAGSGEPTLHSGLGTLIRAVAQMTRTPVAVLTNGGLLHRPEVRVDLLAADAVLPSLDAGSDDVYQRINRPLPELVFDRLVNGLVDFRRVYLGKLWIEVMIVPGLNDAMEALRDLSRVMERIRPDEIHVSTPVRPPAEPWVTPADEATLARAAAALGPKARVVGKRDSPLDLPMRDDLDVAIVEILTRHPMTAPELSEALRGWSPAQIEAALARLRDDGHLRPVERLERTFWSVVGARYGRDGSSIKPPAPSGPPGGTPLR
jgi:wyosine [tRNA(Phe)-imidazoG37] synthetase (radical SAM superfamily)